MADRSNRTRIGAVIAVLLAILVYVRLGRFEGGPITVPDEAVPVWSNSDLSFANKFVEYLFPIILPIGGMIQCPVVPPYDLECMARGRDATLATNNGWNSLLESSHDETVIRIKRDESPEPLEVVLVQRKNASVKKTDAPLVLWAHSGGFTTGSAREQYLTFILNALEDEDDVSETVKDAVWAAVEYRLAPEHRYPSQPDDCFLAFKHLLTEYEIDGERLGGGGVHIAGLSAGGTIAATTALRALQAGFHFDSLWVDEPVMILPERYGDGDLSPLDSFSFRKNAFNRVVPVQWIDWALAGYVGKPLDELSGVTDADLTGGVMAASKWKEAAGNQELPPLVLLTAKADVLQDGGLAFGRVYKEAGGTVYALESSTSHAFAFVFDRNSAIQMVRTWAGLVEVASKNKRLRRR